MCGCQGRPISAGVTGCPVLLLPLACLRLTTGKAKELHLRKESWLDHSPKEMEEDQLDYATGVYRWRVGCLQE